MGNLVTHRRFAHLYINGLYWGLYELCEKINDNFASDYLGGIDEDYDVVDVSDMIDGNRQAYEEMYKIVMKVGSKEQDSYYQQLTDRSCSISPTTAIICSSIGTLATMTGTTTTGVACAVVSIPERVSATWFGMPRRRSRMWNIIR